MVFRGTATLVDGTVTVATDKVKTGYKIYLSVNTPSGTQGFLSAPTAFITNETSFVINSTSATACLVVKTNSIQKLTDTLRAVEGHIDIVLHQKGWLGELNVYYTKESIGTLSGQKSQIRVF